MNDNAAGEIRDALVLCRTRHIGAIDADAGEVTAAREGRTGRGTGGRRRSSAIHVRLTLIGARTVRGLAESAVTDGVDTCPAVERDSTEVLAGPENRRTRRSDTFKMRQGSG